MKTVLVALSVVLIAGCAGVTSNDCLRRAASAEIAVTQSYQSTVTLLKAGSIDKGTAQAALKVTDQANAAVDSAGRLCKVDQPSAFDYLAEATKFLSQATDIRGGV